MNKLALFCLLLSGLLLLLQESTAFEEEPPRTSRFEPLERKNRFRNGGGKNGGRMPKHRPSSSGTTTTMATATGERPRFHGYSPFLVKPSSMLSQQSNNGLILEAGGVRGGDVTSVSGLITGGGGAGSLIQSTQLPPPHHSTNPHRNSEFLKGKSKKRCANFARQY